jgi:hypothetical protein
MFPRVGGITRHRSSGPSPIVFVSSGFSDNTSQSPSCSLNDSGGSGTINTTGANLIVVLVSDIFSLPSPAVFSDTYSNTWHTLAAQNYSGEAYAQFYYAYNAIVGTGHNFTVASGGNRVNIAVAAFSGADNTSAVFETGSDSSTGQIAGSPMTYPSVTPMFAGDVVIDGFSGQVSGSNSLSFNDGFTVVTNPDGLGSTSGWQGALAYLIVSNTSAEAPTASGISGAFFCVGNTSCFKVA